MIWQVKAFAAPTPETLSAVTEWLAENDITGVKTSGAFDDWLTLSIPVSKANQLLQTNFETFVHVPSGDNLVRTLAYSIPQDLVQHIELVHPTTTFVKQLATRPAPVITIPIPSTQNVTERALTAPASCASTVTPACLQALYGIPTTRATQSTNKLGVSGFIDQFAQVG